MEDHLDQQIEQLQAEETYECEMLLVLLNRYLTQFVIYSILPNAEGIMVLKEAVLFLSTRNYNHEVDEMFVKMIENNANRIKLQLEMIDNQTPEEFICKLNLVWCIMRLKMSLLYDVSLHWLRYIHPHGTSLVHTQVNVQVLGTQKFAEIVFGSEQIIARVRWWLLNQFNLRRRNTNHDPAELNIILKMLLQCSQRVYESVFEEAFLDESVVYYQDVYYEWFRQRSSINFINVIDAAIERETQFVCRDLEPSTKVKLVSRLTTRFM